MIIRYKLLLLNLVLHLLERDICNTKTDLLLALFLQHFIRTLIPCIMKRIVLLVIALLPVFCISCNKKEYISSEPLSFNLFLFDRNGTDLLNPSSPSYVDASLVSVEAQFLGKPLTWKQGWSHRYMDKEEVVVDLSGFYYYNFYTPNLAEGLDNLKNTSLEYTIHIEGFPDSKAKFYFNKHGWVYRIDVDGKRVFESVTNSVNHNVKLMF